MSETWWIKPEELDEDQKRIVSLPLDKNYLVLGPPGSGKTNLLLLRASHLYKGGYPDIAILLFSRKLQEFVASGASKYFLSTGKVIIPTIIKVVVKAEITINGTFCSRKIPANGKVIKPGIIVIEPKTEAKIVLKNVFFVPK